MFTLLSWTKTKSTLFPRIPRKTCAGTFAKQALSPGPAHTSNYSASTGPAAHSDASGMPSEWADIRLGGKPSGCADIRVIRWML